MNIDLKKVMAEFSYGIPISVNGASLGTDMKEIPFDLITLSSPIVASNLIECNDKIIRRNQDGTEYELSPKERYEAVKENGGWLKADGVTWKIKNQCIQYIFLTGAVIEQFSIHNEEEIVRRFGKPECITANGIGMEYQYPSRRLRILWSKHDSRLYSVDIGKFTESKKTRKADADRGVFYIGRMRRVSMFSLQQAHSYAGLITGFPTDKWNDRIIEEIKESAAKKYSSGGRLHLIAPQRKYHADREPCAFGKPETIPSIACVAEFTSVFPARDFEASNSSVTLIWFQDKLAMPIDKEVQNEIELLNWQEIAFDYSN